MRVIAILATYNEARFITGCLEHLFRHGVETHLIDNGSTDATVALAERHLGKGLLGIETLPRGDVFRWDLLLERKDQLATSLDTDWVMHVDADEVHLPPPSGRTLAAALAEVDAAGCNAVDFQEFTFVPTREAPDHDHAEFRSTMRRYYAFRPWSPFAMRAWRHQPRRVGLADSGGHGVDFPDLRLYPESFPVRHYLFLSIPHATEKYVTKRYDPAAVARGWHGWRASLSADMIALPNEGELRPYVDDATLDASAPRTRHLLADAWQAHMNLPGGRDEHE